MRCFLKHDKTGQHIHCPNQKTANKIRSQQERPKDWSLLFYPPSYMKKETTATIGEAYEKGGVR